MTTCQVHHFLYIYLLSFPFLFILIIIFSLYFSSLKFVPSFPSLISLTLVLIAPSLICALINCFPHQTLNIFTFDCGTIISRTLVPLYYNPCTFKHSTLSLLHSHSPSPSLPSTLTPLYPHSPLPSLPSTLTPLYPHSPLPSLPSTLYPHSPLPLPSAD